MSKALPPIPPTTDTVIVFSLNPSQQLFDSGFYHPAITHGRSPAEEIHKVLADIAAARKPFADKLKTITCIYTFIVILAAVGYVVTRFIPGGTELIFIRLIAFFLILILLSTWLKGKVDDSIKKQKKAAEDVLVNYRPGFASRGLNWIVPDGFPRWIELHKDYLHYPGGNQPVYMPPVNQQPMAYHGVPPQQDAYSQQQFMNQNQYYPPAAHQV